MSCFIVQTREQGLKLRPQIWHNNFVLILYIKLQLLDELW